MNDAVLAFTRHDVARHLGDSFETLGIVTRDDLLRVLPENGASPALVELVASQVPMGTRLPDMRALWQYLRDLPVG